MGRAAPNPGHRALAALERAGVLRGVITQNVDGLHQAAGSRRRDRPARPDRGRGLPGCRGISGRAELQRRLTELNPGFARPGTQVETAPDGDAELDETAGFRLAECTGCGGVLKPDVVFFGENVPRDRVERAFALVDELAVDAGGLLVAGSSLTVMSGLRFVRHAHALGVPVVDREPGRDPRRRPRDRPGRRRMLRDAHRARERRGVTADEPDTMDPVDPVDDPQDPAAAPPPEKRIGDRERREVDAQLRQAHDDGVLTLTEYDERVALCWAARTRGDLDALTRDLPDPAPLATTPDAGSPPAAPPAEAAAAGSCGPRWRPSPCSRACRSSRPTTPSRSSAGAPCRCCPIRTASR